MALQMLLPNISISKSEIKLFITLLCLLWNQTKVTQNVGSLLTWMNPWMRIDNNLFISNYSLFHNIYAAVYWCRGI